MAWNKVPVTASNCHYEDGNIVITTPGVYFVYSQVQFEDNNDTYKPIDGKTMAHYVYLNRYVYMDPKHKQALMQSAVAAEYVNKRVTSRSYLGGVFEFDICDRVSVGVTEPKYVELNPDLTYVGLFLISPKKNTSTYCPCC